jgi:hypothetical protein
MSRPGGILALDLSSSVGWAYGNPDDRVPLCGVWVLPTGDLGRLLASFENELEDAIIFHRPALIMCEAPLPPTHRSNASTWRHQLGLAALAESTAYRHDIRFREQACSTIRLSVLGTARFPNGDPKDAVLAYCRTMGWTVPDHNAGDACVVWQYTRCNMPTPRRVAA